MQSAVACELWVTEGGQTLKRCLVDRRNSPDVLLKKPFQHKATAGCRSDDEIHEDDDRVVAPTIGTVFSPEAAVPFEDLFLDGAKHYEDETEGSKLSEDTEGYAQRSGAFNHA